MVVFEQPPQIGPDPQGDHQEKGQSRGVEQEVQFVQLDCGCDGRVGGGHEFLEDDVGGDKDDGGPKGADETEGVVKVEVEGAGEHDAERQGEEGDVCARGVADAKEQGVGSDGEQGGEGLARKGQ